MTAGINSTPGVCGGRACVGNTRIAVWLLESYRRLGVSEAELLDNYPTLQAQDLTNAWAHVASNLGDIERDIAENSEEDDDD